MQSSSKNQLEHSAFIFATLSDYWVNPINSLNIKLIIISIKIE